jgi:membrane-associated phospholipid phosphatase
MLGISYFESFYSRAASVFGAMPSMHNAYPLLGLFTAWSSSTWKTRPIHVGYFLWMFTASLYLDHHWVVDAIAGWCVAVAAVLVAGRLVGRQDDRASRWAPVIAGAP